MARVDLAFGPNRRDGSTHEELHAACIAPDEGCAFHETDGVDGPRDPHWHPCRRHAVLPLDVELWLLRLHNEPERWKVDEAMDSLAITKVVS